VGYLNFEVHVAAAGQAFEADALSRRRRLRERPMPFFVFDVTVRETRLESGFAPVTRPVQRAAPS
jgi:hypothetical protein